MAGSARGQSSPGCLSRCYEAETKSREAADQGSERDAGQGGFGMAMRATNVTGAAQVGSNEKTGLWCLTWLGVAVPVSEAEGARSSDG